ncbi:hypothetical protein C1Y63_10690 [Corynebacterium sp. 13CS0277]|nr:hypothetical protein C1Y63_10690 [Corynebacterium sp. 13CS0277]
MRGVARHAAVDAGRFAQVTFASFAAGAHGEAAGSSGGWRVGPTVDAQAAHTQWVAANAPTQLHPVQPVDDFLSQEDIDSLPRRFEYVPPALGPQGAAAYLQSVPAGSDATGRPGNVFSHAFIDQLPHLPAPVPYPTDAYRGASFATPFRKTAVNQVRLQPAQPATPVEDSEDGYAVAWLVVRQLLGDRSGALWALQAAVENPATLAVLVVRNNLDAGYWLRALSATTTPSMAYATWRLSTFERARTMHAARLLQAGYRIVCVPEADRQALAEVPHAELLTIIDPADPATYRHPVGDWSQLTQAALTDEQMVGTLVNHLVAVSDAAWPLVDGVPLPVPADAGTIAAYGQALALAVVAFEADFSPEAVLLARRMLDGPPHSPTAALAAQVRRHTGGAARAWEELLDDPVPVLLARDGREGAASGLLEASLDARGLERAQRTEILARLARVIDAADTRSDTRGHARAELVHRLLALAGSSGLIDDEAVDVGLTAPLVEALATSAAFAAHLGSHDASAAPAALARVVRAGFIRRHTLVGTSLPHPDWASRAGTTTTPTARAAYDFPAEWLTRAEDTAGQVLSGRAVPRPQLQELLQLLAEADIAAIDAGSRPPGAHSNDSVSDIVALLKSRGHGADVAASRIEDIRHQRRIVAAIHPDADLVDIIGVLRGPQGREVADVVRTVHPEVARTSTFEAACLRLWVVLVPFARAYPLLGRAVGPDEVAALAEAIRWDAGTSSAHIHEVYERYLRADLADATADEEVLAAAGQWLRYQAAGVADPELGSVVATLIQLIAADQVLPEAYRGEVGAG